MQSELDELQLDLGALGDRRSAAQVGELALGEHGGVVGVDALLRREEEALLRGLLDLGEPRAARAEQERQRLRVDLDPERLGAGAAASARSLRSTSSAADASERTMPSPAQVGHFFVRISRGPSVTFCRVISTRPSGEISTT